METSMKQITVAGLVIVMLGSITSNSVWARDEGWHGNGFRGIGGHNGGGFEGHDRHNDGGFGGNAGHYGGKFGGNGRHYGRGLGFYGLPYYSPYYVYPLTIPQRQTNYWYYCPDPEGYYPDVEECPDGWQRVAPNYWYYCQDPEGYYPDVGECLYGWQLVVPKSDED
jgi:hypothetical protein